MTLRRRGAAVLFWAALISLTVIGCKGDEPSDTPGEDTGGDDVGGGDTGGEDTGGEDTACTLGDLGCECAAGNECSGDLVCVEGVCEEDTGCTVGDTGCACASGDTCTDASDECVAGTCQPRTECVGELGCACGEGDVCDAGLVCASDVCESADGTLIELSGGDARACDILVEAPGVKIQDVVFPAGYRGRMRTRDDSTAIAVIRTEDSAMSGVVAALVFEDEGDADDVTSVSVTCYDRLGQAADGVTANAR